VAAKEIISATMDPTNILEFEHEARMLTQLNHPQVLRVFGFCTTTAEESKDNLERRYIVTEFASNGSLEEAIVVAANLPIIPGTNIKDASKKISKMQALEWAVQIASGTAFLHRKGFVHRDMKPQNVLLNKSNDALVADLGTVRRPPSGLLPYDKVVPSTMSNEEKERYMKEFCQEIDEEQGRATTTMKSFHGMSFMKGTPMYMAPEQFQSQDYSYPVDVWAYGVTLVRLFTLKLPYPEQYSMQELIVQVGENKLAPVAVEAQEVPHFEVLKVINDCLQFDFTKRPTMKEVERRLTKVLNVCKKMKTTRVKRRPRRLSRMTPGKSGVGAVKKHGGVRMSV
jgi:serine/threonine protein kinase